MTVSSHKKLMFCLFQGAALAGAVSAAGCDPVTEAAAVVNTPSTTPDLDVSAAPDATERKPKCPSYTTLACGEEANGCSGC